MSGGRSQEYAGWQVRVYIDLVAGSAFINVLLILKSLLQRQSLITQAAALLRSELERGAWAEFLPGERQLAVQLGISRPTLRAALECLTAEGWLKRAHGRPTRISRPVSTTPVKRTQVILLSPVPLRVMPPLMVCWVDELRERLAAAGNGLELLTLPAAFGADAEKSLKHLEKRGAEAVWLLHLAPERVQRWFAQRGFPCLVAGSAVPGVDLPSVDLDHRATCRHAGGLLAAKGKMRPVLLLPDTHAPGDTESEQGFLEGYTKIGGRPLILRHDGTVPGLRDQVSRALHGRTKADAFVVARTAHALTVLTCLLMERCRVPGEVAVISRDDDFFLAHTTPEMARYASDPAKWARVIFKGVRQLMEGVPLKAHHRLVPDFIRGGTL